jgi:hypothetical protein
MASVHSVLATPIRGCPIGSSSLTHAILDSFKIPDLTRSGAATAASVRPGLDLEDVHSATSAAPRTGRRRRGRCPPDRSDNGAQGGSRRRDGACDGAPCAAWFIGVVTTVKLTKHGQTPLARLQRRVRRAERQRRPEEDSRRRDSLLARRVPPAAAFSRQQSAISGLTLSVRPLKLRANDAHTECQVSRNSVSCHRVLGRRHAT